MELRRGAFSLALLVGSVNAACVNFRPPPPPIAASAAGMAPTKVWTARAGRRFTPPVEVSEGMLYGGSLDRKVYAVDLTSGDVRWSVRMPGMIVGGVVVSGDTVYVASSRPQGRVSALRRSNGKQIWRATAPPIGAPLALIDGTLIALGERGEVLGLDPRTGKTRWQRRIGVARIAAVPAGSAEMLIAGTDSLYRVSVDSGEVIARAASPGTIVSPWLSRPGALIAGTTDSQVVSLDPVQLQLNWSLKVDAPVIGSPGALGDTLFLATRIGTVYRIEPGPAPRSRVIASLHWPVTAPVTIDDREILLGGADGVIRALRPDGREVWRVRVWRPVELGPVTLEDGLIAMGGNGDLHRYRQ
jgi:putative pyrroloquinoline-quinone binding quinoprotein/putative pyrroloquinoline-quinone-binding quinoprotein